MTTEKNVEQFAQRLGDPSLDAKTKANLAIELRDGLDYLCSGPTYLVFLRRMIPIFTKLLEGPPIFVSSSYEQKLRNVVLEIFHRLPSNPPEPFESYAPQVVDLLIGLAKVDNEDNVVLCMKALMDIVRHHPKATADKVQPFLDLIQELFETMDQVVKDTFDTSSTAPGMPSTPGTSQNFQSSPKPGSPATSVPDLGGPDQPSSRPLQKGMQSFKVLAECPIIVVSIFQAHRTHSRESVVQFVPLIKGLLLLQASPQERAHAEAKAQGKIFTGVSKEIKNRAAFGDFITAQVKTMSFLAYLLRVHSHFLQDFLPTLPDIVVRLLRDCPREKSGARKELLVAIRHIINFNFRKVFLVKIDELLDERTLIGDGLTVYETMRPLAYSMLADLLHHVREHLNTDQIRKTIEVYTKNLHDNFPGTSFQTMSAKLLLNMAESIAKKSDNKEDGRHFLVMILDAIGDKFAAMNRQYPNAVKLTKLNAQNPGDDGPDIFLAEDESCPEWDEIDIFNATPIKTSNRKDRASNPIFDNKFLFKNLVNGLKQMFFQLKETNPATPVIELSNAPSNWADLSFGYNAEEVNVIRKLFREGARCFRYYNVEESPVDFPSSPPVEYLANFHMSQIGREEKDLLENFSTVFHCIDPATFHEVFQAEIPDLYEMMFEHGALLHIAQFFLASEITSSSFAGMVLQFLMDHLEDVGSADVTKASVLLKMFKLSFMAVTLFAAQNERILLPHVTNIITRSIQLSANADEPLHYFILLRSLFRSIGGGRFELLYKEILPLLEHLLMVFNDLLSNARKPQERDLYVELTLTVPARLSHLLPHLGYLMKPLVIALRAGSDLVGQGLRTLELCVDNLTADYLDPIMAPVMDDLMSALWDHLRPSPYNHQHAHNTMRILGKLGGRNRKFINKPPGLNFKEYADDESSFNIKLIGSHRDRAFPAQLGIQLAIAKLKETPRTQVAKKSDAFYKQQAFRLISSQVKLLIGFENLPQDIAHLVRLQANDLADQKFDVSLDFMERPVRDKSVVKKAAQEDTLKDLLKACIFSTTTPGLKSSASSLLTDVCRHFALLEVGLAMAREKHKRKPFNVHTGDGPVFIDTRVIMDAIDECLSDDHPDVRDAAENLIQTFYDTALIIFGSPEKLSKLPFFTSLSEVFTHSCYREEWYRKAGGGLGIRFLVSKIELGDSWMIDRQLHLVRALLYVIEDVPNDLPARTRTHAQETMEIILRKCNKNASVDDINDHQSKLYQICGQMVFELHHMNKQVRETAEKAFVIIADVIGAEVHQLMAPLKDRLLTSIFNKPLRALPTSNQIGYIDAVTFCLRLHHDLVVFNEQFMRLLMEALALADAEDEVLAQRPDDYRNAQSIVNLRVSCLHLLSMATSFQDWGNGVQPQTQSQTRAKIISVFFKSLYSKSADVIEAANSGLKDVLIKTNKLPKDLLQQGLRPILMTLQEPKRLSVPCLDGLARLLTLLTNYFKVEIGQKLLEHMKVLADDAILQKASFSLLEHHPQVKIVAAIFNIFHLLPQPAISFMDSLVNKVLELEEKLRRTNYRPFREPLVKYLNRYPTETWKYFQARFHDLRFGRMLAQTLAAEASRPLREAMAADLDGFMKNAFDLPDPKQKDVAAVNAIHAVHSFCMHDNATVLLNPQNSLRGRLLASGRDLEEKFRKATLARELRLPVVQAGEQLMESFSVYLSRQPRDLDFFFEVIGCLTAGQLKDCQPIYSFIYEHIVSSDSIEQWRTVILRCLNLYSQGHVDHKVKTFMFHYLVNPIFTMDIMRNWQHLRTSKGTKLMDKAMTEAIHDRLWKPQLGDIGEETTQRGIDHSRMELLQMSAMIVKYHHSMVSDARKDIIKFAWNYIRLEDIVNKYGAYVLISYFIAHYETPAKIVVQIYVALLKAHQTEGRGLVMQALELLAPILPKRVGVGHQGDRYPIWAKWPRRIMSEDSSNLPQLTSIFHFFIRQPDLFYESRDYFIPLIIPTLSKIAHPPSASGDSKKLALNLITLIWKWEQRRAKGTPIKPVRSQLEASPNKKRKFGDTSSVSTPSTTTGSMDRTDYVIPHAMKVGLIKYLVQFIVLPNERYPVTAEKFRKEPPPGRLPQILANNDGIKTALELLADFLAPEYWGDLGLDLLPKLTQPFLASEKTDKAFASEKTDKPDEKFITSVINTLQVVRVFVNIKSDEWIIKNLQDLQQLLEKSLRSENPEVQDCLHDGGDEVLGIQRGLKPLIKRILDALPDPPTDEEDTDMDSPLTEFVTFLSAAATKMLSNSNNSAGVNTLWTLSKRTPAEIDQHIPHAMKALNQLAKDQVSYSGMPNQIPTHPPARPGENQSSVPDSKDLEIGVNLIEKSIDLISVRMSTLGEQRRPFLSVLASLVERSQNINLCSKILGMVETWIFDSNELWPTLKEKTAVLHKMLLFEARTDQTLLQKFLELIIRVYEDPKIRRTELTVRLEHAFLVGTRAQDVKMRNRFMEIFDNSLSRTASSRLSYVLTSQNWDTLADSFWLSQAIQLIMGSVEMTTPIHLHQDDFRLWPATLLYKPYEKDPRKDSIIVDDELEDLMTQHKRFCREMGEIKAQDVLGPLCQLQHTDANVAYELWVILFPLCWSALLPEEKSDLEKGMVSTLTKEYHSRQTDRRPNVVQALLEGIARAKNPRFKIPPHVLKHLCKTYDAWYTAAVMLEDSAIDPIVDTPVVRESNLDALVQIYSNLGEDDLFYGTWRRRCRFVETNAGLSYEQNGIWDKAQKLYETAQIKARTGAVPFSQGEYMLWEDHWVICAEKLQQWDILIDFAKHENFNDLLLESTWRNIDPWQNAEGREALEGMIKGLLDAPTPRRLFFQAFMSLLKLHSKQLDAHEFGRICDESVQLSIRKWHQLPKRITNAHIPILQNFQQLVELHDASVICNSLEQTNERNLDTKSHELKLLLSTWRDRLPNVWDDINAWQDLVTWRQHIFQLINGTYLSLIPQQGATNMNTTSFAYRGHHETAWIINRFAHVARKHQLPDVCIAQLSKIYTLPNIEIQEAFLKLREQAKCHYQNSTELNSGLDLINNTNLHYFTPQQKAEFFTLKGMFLAKLGQKGEANDAFGVALFYDIRMPKAWAEWGRYNDNLFKLNPGNLEHAKSAVSCYLEAAGLYKSAKSRKLLSRILWLLSLDNEEGTIMSAFDEFRGDSPTWYWITFIPQLLTSLSRREARISRDQLRKIATNYPQSLFFQLRTNREDMLAIKKQEDSKQQQKLKIAAQQGQQTSLQNKQGLPENNQGAANAPKPVVKGEGSTKGENAANGTSSSPKQGANGQNGTQEQNGARAAQPKQPWEYSDEIMSALKTAFPLLALSMETMVDQIQKNFRCPADEDAYRLIVALLNDGLAYVGRMPSSYAADVKLPQSTEANITRFAETILPHHIRKAFEADFVAKKPTMHEYIQKLRMWRDRFEEKLDRRPLHNTLEGHSPHLSQFRYQKFDDVEVPGQYLLHKDNNKDFIRIERFMPDVDQVRTIGVCHRRLRVRGHDGSLQEFAVQHPAARHCRREERMLQLFRFFNVSLAKRKESRRRNIQFHLPLMIPLAPHIRLVSDDASYISLHGIYDDYCRRNDQNKDDPLIFTMDRLRMLTNPGQTRTSEQATYMRLETFTAVQEKWVPKTIVLDYVQQTYPQFADFWLFRRQFSYQLAALSFLTYIMHMTSRFPHKMNISRATGNIWGSELIPAMMSNQPLFQNLESVPFRLTPNLQTLMGPLAMEGIFSCAMMAIARCLTEPEHELYQQLSIFVRDEMIFWFTQSRHSFQEQPLRETVHKSSELIVKRAVSLAEPPAVTSLPANQTIIDLIARATSPLNLAQTDALWMPYL
ncbi:MAG: hypothetical protein M1834_008481 [Cirrosporium novae-zelandiae]|nr:MAG: hypothetical protein M1834_008481 [Cirrosporium novae-zelandiae]